jgi:Uma2 family endonuclease
MTIAQRTLTLEEFLSLPDTKPAGEYQNGRITQKVSPQGKHSLLQAKWVVELNRLALPPPLGMAFPELRCTFAGRSIVPDVAFFAWDRVPWDPSGASPLR